MKKLKKIFPLLMVILLLIPKTSTFAYSDGFMNGKLVNLGYNSTVINQTTNAITDGDESTGQNLSFVSNTENDVAWIQFGSPVNVNSYQVKASAGALMKMHIYTNNSATATSITVTPDGIKRNLATTYTNVTKIAFTNESTIANLTLFEADVYGNSDTYPNGLIDSVGLTGTLPNFQIYDNDWNTAYSTSNASGGWTFTFAKLVDITKAYVPGNSDGLNRTYTVTLYDSNGTVLASVTNFNPKSNTSFLSISAIGVKKAFVKNNSTSYNDSIREIEFFGAISTASPPPNTQNITELKSTAYTNKIDFTWTNPGDTSFYGTKIYKNNELIATLDKTINSYSVSSLSPGTEYTFKITSINPDGSETTGVIQKVKTIEKIKEISEVKAETEYNRVNLSWGLPDQQIFKHVNIYRAEVQEEPGFFESMFSYVVGSTVYAEEEPQKIFETNGTYFNDFTVEPEKTYEYTLTTQSTDGQESEGVTIEATTKKEPIPVMEGLSYEIDQNGDYVYTWSEPTKGTVKVLINGTEYASVPGTNGSITVPKEDSKLNVMGDPEISFQPIGEYGAEGEIYSMKGKSIETPFSVNDLLSSGMSLLWVVAPFLLISLSFLLVPSLRKLIVQALRRFRKVPNDKEGRFRTYRNALRERRSSKEESSGRHEGKEHIEKRERLERERQEREKSERESRELLERERTNKEITKKRENEPRELTDKPLSSFRRAREPRAVRESREPNRQPRQPREKTERRRGL